MKVAMKQACVLKQLYKTSAWSQGGVTCGKHVKGFPSIPRFRF